MRPPIRLCTSSPCGWRSSPPALTYAKLPAEVREQAKLIARDSLGNQIAASAISEAGIKIVQQATEWGGKPEATVIGFGAKLPVADGRACATERSAMASSSTTRMVAG